MPDVMVLIPGILGSVLKKDGHDVWAASGSGVLRALASMGGNVRDLALTGDDPEAEELDDGVTADRLMEDIHLIPGFWKIDGYSHIVNTIRGIYEVTENINFFRFPYDWRRDNRAAAHRLDRLSEQWLSEWTRKRGSDEHDDPKLILIAHSMGGLVARYFLEALGGWRRTRALITFGTPYRGSVNALETLANGVKKFHFFDLSELTRTFTSAYQLLPIYPCYTEDGSEPLRVTEASIPNVDSARARDALRFHEEIEKAVETNQEKDAYRTSGYTIFPIVGIEQPTNQSARAAGNKIEPIRMRGDKDERGDGTVPRVSATPLELSGARREMFAATRHASLQNADAVLTHLVGVVLDLYLNLGEVRAPAPPPPLRIGLELEDVYAPDEPITLRALPTLDVELEAVITDLDDRPVARATLSAGTEELVHEFPPLPGGAYRIHVSGPSDEGRASDVFAVYDANLEGGSP